MPLDYVRIEKSLLFLAERAEAGAPPSLAEAAAHVGLSPAHYQRMFRRWAGVSPKRFLLQIGLERAKELLLDRRSVLDAALGAGLSGPGRLHDQFATVEAMTPGEFARGGASLRIHWGVGGSPFGRMLVAETHRGICGLIFLDPSADGDNALRNFFRDLPAAEFVRNDQRAQRKIDEIIASLAQGAPESGSAGAPLKFHVRGTNFQLQVWRALLLIPPGRAASYGDIAAAIRRPRASRAVGQAVGANPVSVLIPCHRVIRSTGALGHYSGGVHRKRALLAWESAARDSTVQSSLL